MVFKVKIANGDIIPRFYGFAYADPCSLSYVLYPYPINFVVMAAHRFQEWLYIHILTLSKQEQHEMAIVGQGEIRGYEKGYSTGYGEGFNHGRGKGYQDGIKAMLDFQEKK